MTRSMEPNQQVTIAEYAARAAKPDGRTLRKQRRLQREAMRALLGVLVLRIGTEQAQSLLLGIKRRARALSVQP